MGEELKSIKAGFDYGGNTLSLYNIYALWNSSPIVGRGIINTEYKYHRSLYKIPSN